MPSLLVNITIAPGPGQRPERPHPAPNNIDPMINLASMVPVFGKANFSASFGFGLDNIVLNVKKLITTADIMTNINEGSQLVFRVKNPRIFDTLHIPDITSPNPKIAPTKYEIPSSFLIAVCYLIIMSEYPLNPRIMAKAIHFHTLMYSVPKLGPP
jgi:hypothetical protein